MGRHSYCGHSWWNPGNDGVIRDARADNTHHPQRSKYAGDGSHLWKDGTSRSSTPVATVASECSLVRGRVPDHSTCDSGNTPGPLVFSTKLLSGIIKFNDKTNLLLLGIAAGLMVGFFEEVGWTGFAKPKPRLRYRILTNGLIVGFRWGAWHIFLNVVWVSGACSGELSPALFLTARGLGDLVGLLPACRILMVWVYNRTGGSLLVAMLMHASLTASTMILEPPAISGVNLLIYDLVSAIAMWTVVAVIIVANKGNFSNKLKNEQRSPKYKIREEN